MNTIELLKTVRDLKAIEQVMIRRKKLGRVIETVTGPTVTTYYFSPGYGVKTSDVANAAEDLARQIGVNAVRVTSTPSQKSILIEVPRVSRETIPFESVLADSSFMEFPGVLPLILGKDTQDILRIIDLATSPHLLIAGTTGSGKSVAMNGLILSLLERCSPHRLQMLMIDPKIVELTIYDGLPHLLRPVVTNTDEAIDALTSAVQEMERRYEMFKVHHIRNIQSWHRRGETLHYLVIVIDELAELLLVEPKKTAKACSALIQRLAQAGRAAGIHIIAATQRPTTDVVSGTIKSNFPARIALSMADAINSRTIINQSGAETLQGAGDMLYLSPIGDLSRIQGPFLQDDLLIKKLNVMRN